jgi:hypothetical protein
LACASFLAASVIPNAFHPRARGCGNAQQQNAGCKDRLKCARHSSLFFRRPQCVSLRSGLNSRARFRFNARMRQMRANIVGPLESDELATVRSRIGSSNGRDQLIQEAGNKQHRGRAPSITKTERRRSANLLQMPRGLMCKLRQRGRSYGGPVGSRGIDPSLRPPPAVAANPLREIGNPCRRPSPSSFVPKRRQCRRPSRCRRSFFPRPARSRWATCCSRAAAILTH